MKRFLKNVFKGIAGILVLMVILYGGFHLWEYATGGKYVNYLKENSETLPLDQPFTFKTLDDDIRQNRLILVGEIHGFEEPQKFDYELFTHLHREHQVRTYFAELDFVQALTLNQYLEHGEEKDLHDALKKWAVVQGRNNKDYYDKYRKFHQYYQQLSEHDKFQFIGIDKMQDINLTLTYLNALHGSTQVEIKETVDLDTVMQQINRLDAIYSGSPDTLSILKHIRKNISYYTEKTNREKVMFENFHSLYPTLDGKESKAYGYFGLYHVFQYGVNGQQPLASQIRSSDLGLEKAILSINFLMVDSYMAMPANQLPAFMSEGGAYAKLPVSSDVMLFLYIYGIKDFKRMTPEYHKSLVKLNGENSPYAMSNRMNKTIQILPLTDKFEFDEKGKPYVQYTLFVRNSDWAAPEE